jgi:hypothetical protein
MPKIVVEGKTQEEMHDTLIGIAVPLIHMRQQMQAAQQQPPQMEPQEIPDEGDNSGE